MFNRHNNARHPLSMDTSSPAPDSLDTPKRWTRLHQLLHDNHGVRYFVIALGVILAAGIIILGIINLTAEPPATSNSTVTTKKKAPKFYSPLTGLDTSEDNTKRPVTAIMIENGPEARPQSGLKDAGVVYEAVAEGGITRFIALYQESRPGLIGPVRSVRPYYVEWASAYDPAVAHIGGSQRALSMIRSGNYGVDMDQFFNASTYWRADDREAPHDVYTTFDKLDSLRQSKGKTSSSFTTFSRIDGKKSDAPNASSIDIDVSSGIFHVNYEYDAASNSYIRKQGGEGHVDREGGQIKPSVVIAIKVAMSIGMEDGYREQISTTGTGQAYVFQNGTVTEGTWHRDGEKGPLRITAADGSEVKLVRGQTWITALSSSRGVSWQ